VRIGHLIKQKKFSKKSIKNQWGIDNINALIEQGKEK